MSDVTFSASQIRSLCGWVPPHQRTRQQNQEHERIVGQMPDFKIFGDSGPLPDKTYLWDYSKAINGGKHFATLHQLLGSCVGEGATNVVWYLSAMEVARLGDPEKVLLPWMGYIYGRSRYRAGIEGYGEGSTGSGAAEAVREDGVIAANEPGLPRIESQTDTDIVWGKDIEYSWSDGERIDQKWLDLGVKHLVKTTAQIKSTEEAMQAIANGYPLTDASDVGFQMSPQVSNGYLLNRYSDTWNHQTCFLAYDKHPQLGLLFWYQNSWGSRAHGVDPAGGPPGGFWITEKDAARIIRQGETFAYSQFDGFPAQKLDHHILTR